MTVKELVEKLKTVDQNAEVGYKDKSIGGNYYEDTIVDVSVKSNKVMLMGDTGY